MATTTLPYTLHTTNDEKLSEGSWQEIIVLIHQIAQKLIYNYKLCARTGEEEDLIKDIVQETLYRLLRRVERAQRGELAPVDSLKAMSVVIALNYCKDLCRREQHFVHFEPDMTQRTEPEIGSNYPDVATENAYRSALFDKLASEIVTFPPKQCRALLIDLAEYTDFDEQPGPLESALLRAGLQLRKYRGQVPQEAKARYRHSSLLNHAYKRLRTAPQIRHYIATL